MSWKQVLGHEAAIASFTSAYQRGRLGHAYLFVGPAGVGKHTFARQLAKTLLCEQRTSKFEACDQCDACKLIDAGTHPDLFTVAKPADKNVLPISLIRRDDGSPDGPVLLEQLAMKPARGKWKVAILDDADDLGTEAANAFLKTLEEPPPGSLLLLIGGLSEDNQLPTILSRCQVIRFAPIAPALVRKVLAANEISDSSRQDRLLQLAGGSPGQALAIDDDAIWDFRKQLLDTLRQDKIDPAETAKVWMEFINNAGKDAAAHRGRASLVFRMLVVMLDSALKLSLGASIQGMDAAEAQALRKLAERMGEDRLLALIERSLEADRHVDRYVQLVLIIEAFVDAMCR